MWMAKKEAYTIKGKKKDKGSSIFKRSILVMSVLLEIDFMQYIIGICILNLLLVNLLQIS